MTPKNMIWMGVLPAALLLSACFNDDYAKLCGDKLAHSLQAGKLKVLDSKWSKFGERVRVSMSFNATDQTGQVITYNGSCSIEGDKVVSHTTKSVREG